MRTWMLYEHQMDVWEVDIRHEKGETDYVYKLQIISLIEICCVDAFIWMKLHRLKCCGVCGWSFVEFKVYKLYKVQFWYFFI